MRLKADFLRLILGKPANPARLSILVGFVETYMRLNPREQQKFEEIVTVKPEFREVSRMVTVYEKAGIRKGRLQGRREGEKKGRLEGKLEGKIEGKQASLLLLLEQKFGGVGAELRGTIREIKSESKLDSLLTAVMKVESIEQLGL